MPDPDLIPARIEMRHAVKRLMSAINRPAVEVTVQRRDVELLLCSRVMLQLPEAPK